jgi:chemotaxis methyl-accepting protein methylase
LDAALLARLLRANLIPAAYVPPARYQVWHAGCVTGEEVYSLAIVLAEEGLLERATLYATDFNDETLAQARKGIYPFDKMREFTQNYHQAGGRTSFAEYYHARYGSAVMADSLKKRITFANHNLVTDEVFGERHLVFCRNVLILQQGTSEPRPLAGRECLRAMPHLAQTAPLAPDDRRREVERRPPAPRIKGCPPIKCR